MNNNENQLIQQYSPPILWFSALCILGYTAWFNGLGHYSILIILPLGFILTIARIIGIVSLKNRLKLMNNLSIDIINVVEDPAFLNLKK